MRKSVSEAHNCHRLKVSRATRFNMCPKHDSSLTQGIIMRMPLHILLFIYTYYLCLPPPQVKYDRKDLSIHAL